MLSCWRRPRGPRRPGGIARSQQHIDQWWFVPGPSHDYRTHSVLAGGDVATKSLGTAAAVLLCARTQLVLTYGAWRLVSKATYTTPTLKCMALKCLIGVLPNSEFGTSRSQISYLGRLSECMD
jgi:hypothetical protein